MGDRYAMDSMIGKAKGLVKFENRKYKRSKRKQEGKLKDKTRWERTKRREG